ncbi:MAG: alpha-hydroxy acid oxidase [Burkholderiaceae bacterium]
MHPREDPVQHPPGRSSAGMLSLDDFERAARQVLPRPVFAYVAGGAEDNLTFDDNRRAYRDLALVPRVLRNVASRSQQVSLLGRSYAAPFGIAPMGMLALSAYRGDIVLARAAHAANIPTVISGASLVRLEEIVQAAPASWFQAYLPGDPERITALLGRVAAAGVETLMLTVDTPVAGNRENNIRAGFSTPLRPSLRLALDGLSHPGWLLGTVLPTLWRHGMPYFENSFAERGAPILSSTVLRDFAKRDHFDWSHVAAIRKTWKGPLVLKGILNPADGEIARAHGVDALVVSNHGGRQLDGAIAPLRVLGEIVERAAGMPVMLDSGLRRGADVLKALALGAAFVFLGRPFNFAAAVGGQAGVARAIELLRDEIDRNMALLGVNRCAELGRGHVRDLRAPLWDDAAALARRAAAP